MFTVFRREVPRKILAASGNVTAIHELMELTQEHQFFSTYIRFICDVDVQVLKSHLIAVMTGWYESVIQKEEEEILSILKRDYEAKVK